MKNLTLTISDIARLNRIQNQLAENKLISTQDKLYLSQILVQIPTMETMLFDKVTHDETYAIKYIDVNEMEINIIKWSKLFNSIPGRNNVYSHYLTEDTLMLKKGVIAIAQFTPSIAYHLDNTKLAYQIRLKHDCTAAFWLPTSDDVEKYPELYNFKGSWKEAYYLLIETLKKGWPMEEFPEELLPLLKK